MLAGRRAGSKIMSAEEKKYRPFGRSRGVRRSLHPLNSLISVLRLNARPADEAALAQAMGKGRIDWDSTVGLAMEHLLAPAIWPALAEKNLATSMPDAMRQFLAARYAAGGQGRNFLLALEDMYLANAARNARIRDQALKAIAALNAAGIEPAALKGMRLLLGSGSSFRHARCLRDIDLVVPPGDWAKAWAALREAGYRDGSIAPHAAELALRPDNAYNWHHLGRVLDGLGHRAAALAAWRRSLDVIRRCGVERSSDWLAFVDLIGAAETDPAEARSLHTHATKLFPGNPLLRFCGALIDSRAGDQASAIEVFHGLASIDAESFADPLTAFDKRLFGEHAWAALGACYFKLGRYAESAGWFAKAAAADPSSLEYRIKERLSAGKAA
jgi:tetratricopeptide (TPR) repeat protein